MEPMTAEAYILENMNAAQLTAHLADPDVQALLRQAFFWRGPLKPSATKLAWARHELEAVLDRAAELAPACACIPIHSDGCQPPAEVNEPPSEDYPLHSSDAPTVRGWDKASKPSSTARQEVAVGDPYRLLLEDLREDMIQRYQFGSEETARDVCQHVSAWITARLDGPTLGDAARELVAPDATVEEVRAIAPDFTLTDLGELPEGTPHHEGLAFSIDGCGCARCIVRRSGIKASGENHAPGCQCGQCCRTRLVLAELARKWHDTHGQGRWPGLLVQS